jgi:hypothetical protein
MVAARDITLLERGLRAVQVWPSEDPTPPSSPC